MNPYRLPLFQQRLLASLMALLFAMVAAFAIGSPIADAYQSRTNAIAEKRQELTKWQAIAASRPALEAALAAANANSAMTSLTLPPSTEAQAAAGVQATLRRALLDAEADLKSIQPLEPKPAGAMRKVGVRVVALATHEQLQNALFTIDNATPRLFVSDANIQLASGSRRVVDTAEAPILQIRLDVYAYAYNRE